MPLPIDNYQASLALTQLFALQGVYPSRDGGDSGGFPLGSIRTFAGNFSMGGQGAEGQLLQISQNTAVFSLLGAMYGGDGISTFALPDLDGLTMIGGAPLEYFGRPPIGSSGITLSSDQLPASLGGSSEFIDNYQPSQPVTYLIREGGIFPSPEGGGGIDMMGEIVPFAGNFVPGGYLEAAGQILQIADHETLFQLIGTTYGGDGVHRLTSCRICAAAPSSGRPRNCLSAQPRGRRTRSCLMAIFPCPWAAAASRSTIRSRRSRSRT
jgi:microcystin-dependent protein